MPLISADRVAYCSRRWLGRLVWRLDFERVKTLCGQGLTVSSGAGGDGSVDESQSSEMVSWDPWVERIVYLNESFKQLEIKETKDGWRARCQSNCVLLDSTAVEEAVGRVYSTANLEKLLEVAREGKAAVLKGGYVCDGVLFQSFSDLRMADSDWVRLGFRAPEAGRPPLDAGGENKGLSPKYIRIAYHALPEAERASGGLWSNYVDSCHLGAYFSQITIDKISCTGAFAGWKPGVLVKPSDVFEKGVPYRRHDANIETAGEISGSGSAVWYRGEQYFSFDPTVVKPGCEFAIRWDDLERWEVGIFTEKGKYAPAKEVRSSHFVPPRTKVKRVWFRGNSQAEIEKCVLSPENGGMYKPRPNREERLRLVAKYGTSAVPRNFNKYTESQISRKSQLLKLVEEGTWVYVPDYSRADEFLCVAYKTRGEEQPLAWRLFRQIASSSDTERDPTGEGVFIRMVRRKEIFGNPQYLLKIVKILEKDGWGFFTDEVMRNPAELRKNLLTTVIS